MDRTEEEAWISGPRRGGRGRGGEGGKESEEED